MVRPWGSLVEAVRSTVRENMGLEQRHTGVGRGGRGFTLVDVLVSVAVISVLIGLLMPSFAMVRESARRVKCSSNLRQIGLGLHMYGQSSNEYLPASVFLPQSAYHRASSDGMPELMDTVRTEVGAFPARQWGEWDGIGLLFAEEYLSAPGVFYCPSHPGDHPFNRYERLWSESQGEIVSNYQYRGVGPGGERRLFMINSEAAIVTDMLRSFSDLNHKGGLNLLKAGLAVNWFEDTGDQIAGLMSRNAGGNSSQTVSDAWTRLDGGSSGDDETGGED